MELAGTSVALVAKETKKDAVAVMETVAGALDFVLLAAAVVVVVCKASVHWYCLHWTISTSTEFRDLNWSSDCFVF